MRFLLKLLKIALKAPYESPCAILNEDEEDDLSYHTAVKYGGTKKAMIMISISTRSNKLNLQYPKQTHTTGTRTVHVQRSRGLKITKFKHIHYTTNQIFKII
jgi:hypothetical protein